MADARKAAAKVLIDILNGGKYSNLALADALSRYSLSGADKALTSFLVYGTLDRVFTIDAVINLFAKKGIKSLPPYTSAVLRSAVFQLLFTDKIPESAAVNEAVKLVKSSKENRMSGLVNAVLRSVLRDRDKVEQYIKNAPPYIKYSCHKSLYDSLCKDYGKENAEMFLMSSLKTPKTYLRVNTNKTTANELSALLPNSKAVNQNCIELDSGFDIESDISYKNGLYHAEGISSQFAAEAAAVGNRILDVCAAPGGKSFTIGYILEDDCEVVSCDIYPHRVELIKKGANRLDLKCIKPIVNDATVYNSELGLFDSVLCDVVCSGFGVISRKPDIKLKKCESGIEELQYKILDTSSKYVKSGGRLVYSTCTLKKSENEEITAKFLSEHKDFVFDTDSYNDKTFFPHMDNTDGFFISVFKKV